MGSRLATVGAVAARAIVLLVILLAACGGTAGARVDAPSADAPAPIDAPIDAPGSAAGSGYLLYERFDAMATGAPPASPWIVDAPVGAVTVREVPFATDKSVELAKPAGAGTTALAYAFAPQHGRLVIDAKVRARETAGFKAIPYVDDAAGATVASIGIQDDQLVAHVGATTVAVQTVVAGVWYRARVVIDTDRGTFDLYVDGVRRLVGQPLRAAATRVARVRYYVDGDAAGALELDSVRIYVEAVRIGAPPSPVFDARAYGARGDGATDDTAAIQRAIAAAAGTGGSVVLADGTFVTGTLALGSAMTFYVDATATVLGATALAAYPTQAPPTGNTQLGNCQRALIYAEGARDLVIDGGGTIDGRGDGFTGAEATRPILLWAVLGDGVTIRNVNLRRGAVWGLVTMESDRVRIDNVQVESTGITHDGIDLVDGHDLAVRDVTVRAGDDAMCLKTGVRRGLDTVDIRDSLFAGSNGGSNGIKLGTASYGAFANLTVEDVTIKDVQYAAIAVESRQGADVHDLAFRRVQIANAGTAFFVYLAQQDTTHPLGDVPKLGRIDGVAFTDVTGWTASWPHAPHLASLVTGHVFGGTTYRVGHVAFTRVALAFAGGRTAIPAAPGEAAPNQYPEANMFGDLPAWGYYLRHVDGVTFDACRATATAADARPASAIADGLGVVGAP